VTIPTSNSLTFCRSFYESDVFVLLSDLMTWIGKIPLAVLTLILVMLIMIVIFSLVLTGRKRRNKNKEETTPILG